MEAPMFHIAALAERLGISTATVRNWIKTGVIPPPDAGNAWSPAAADALIEKLKNTPRLNARANRSRAGGKRVCYLGITDRARKKLLRRLVADFEASGLSISAGVLALALAQLKHHKLIRDNWRTGSDSKTAALLLDWLAQCEGPPNILANITALFSVYHIENRDDDLLGAFYQSIQNTAQKSGAGSYYTPGGIISALHTISSNDEILDPCCGSGGILLGTLRKDHDPAKIYARDIDEIALRICFVNLALFFNNPDMAANLEKRDIIFDRPDTARQFDRIVTNPPWGGKYTTAQKSLLRKMYPALDTTETFSIALYNSLGLLKNSGELFFFLPYSFLNVSAHRNIRKIVFNDEYDVAITPLGSVFRNVLSESILLRIKKGRPVQNKYTLISPNYVISPHTGEPETEILNRVYSVPHTTLKNNALFGLGIVTGDNAKYLLTEKNENAEAVFRGRDIQKYRFLPPSCFIEFRPELFQQCAPVELYRQTKIAYRFIGERLVCALDRGNSLLLNSANFFISLDFPMETITALFNSDIYTFILQKRFHSKKVLQSHLAALPLPLLSGETHERIFNLYQKTLAAAGDFAAFQAEIDAIICAAFSLNEEQYRSIIRAVLPAKNML
jgi:tRNA1(Val) A37 N6-methylase TrmN6